MTLNGVNIIPMLLIAIYVRGKMFTGLVLHVNMEFVNHAGLKI